MITITDRAIIFIKEMVGSNQNLTLSVVKSGCNGFQYLFDVATTDFDPEHEKLVSINGINVMVDKESIPKVEGLVIDLEEQGWNRVFVFDNPNVTDTCGCGKSFNVE